MRYVELNPVRARLVSSVRQWPWSSAGAHLGLRSDPLVDSHRGQQLVSNWRDYLGDCEVDELFDEIRHREPKPLRQIDPAVPAELERICLKCLEKRITDRYTVATDLAHDLNHWLERDDEALQSVAETRVVPKGLRSFGSGCVNSVGWHGSLVFWYSMVPVRRSSLKQ